MSDGYSYFVIAAVIAAKLDKATQVAQQLSLTASNARAVALRAGERAAGFRPLTDFIDRLADYTISSSQKINTLAAKLTQTSADKMRAETALSHFDTVYLRAKLSPHLDSLDSSYHQVKKRQQQLIQFYNQQVRELVEELTTLKQELRTAVILATLSRVEASQAGQLYQEALNNVADNVADAAQQIQRYIEQSNALVDGLN